MLETVDEHERAACVKALELLAGELGAGTMKIVNEPDERIRDLEAEGEAGRP